MIPITYREFYDVPRLFVVELEGRLMLFDCPFDQQLDDYPEHYRVFELPAAARAKLRDADWRVLPSLGVLIGETPVAQVVFDDTRRSFVDTASLGWTKA